MRDGERGRDWRPFVKAKDRSPAALRRLCASGAAPKRDAEARRPAPGWHLAPASMGWVGLSEGDLCRTLLDRRKNGGRSVADLVNDMTGGAYKQQQKGSFGHSLSGPFFHVNVRIAPKAKVHTGSAPAREPLPVRWAGHCC